MAQIFHRSSNSLAKVSIVGALLLVGRDRLGRVPAERRRLHHRRRCRSRPAVPFSHKHHVGDDGIDCRYCHTSVETSAFAGIPPTETCMSCHSQIWTNAEMLEPVRASFRTGKSLEWVARPRSAGLRVLQPQHSREQGHRLFHLPRPGRQDAADVEGQHACTCSGASSATAIPSATSGPKSEVFNPTYETPAPNQDEIGPKLVAEYKIQSLTDCVTCHR